MRVILCCADFTINDEKNGKYSEVFGMEPFYLEIDSAAILPIGTPIDVSDPQSTQSMQLEVVKHWYVPEDNILYLNVDIDGGEMSPNEFIDYLGRHWTTKV